MDKVIDHKAREHALLSASGAKRWLACPPSARLEDNFPEETSPYAEEGTKAHEISEKILTNLMAGKRKPGFKDEERKAISRAVMPYVDYVWDLFNKLDGQGGAVMFLESRVDFSEYVPDGFGTGDVIILHDTTLHIIDLKYGKGVAVSAKDNPQLRLYAIGAVKLYGDIYDIDTVVMHICQPRLDSYSTEEMSLERLEAWCRDEVAPKAKLAYDGEGEYSIGDHCQFCRASAQCRKRLEDFKEVESLADKLPEQLASNGELGAVLRKAGEIEKWLKKVKAFAIDAMKNGEKFEGVKLVAGRSKTVCTDEDKLLELMLGEGVEEALLFKPREMVSATELKSIIGKKHFEEITKDIYEKTPGSPTIDLAESKKEEWKPGGDFADVDTSKF